MTLEESKALIKLANSKASLLEILISRGLKIERIKGSEWSHMICCPIHADRSPSFGFNYRTNTFHCRGCHKAGGPVEFLSDTLGIPRTEIANSLLEKYGHIISTNNVSIEHDDEDINKAIIDLSPLIRKMYLDNPLLKDKIDICMQMVDHQIHIARSTKQELTAATVTYLIVMVLTLFEVEVPVAYSTIYHEQSS